LRGQKQPNLKAPALNRGNGAGKEKKQKKPQGGNGRKKNGKEVKPSTRGSPQLQQEVWGKRGGADFGGKKEKKKKKKDGKAEERGNKIVT